MLNEQRKEIDRIDSELIELLQERMSVVDTITKIKLENNIEVFDKSREAKQKDKIKVKLKHSPYEKAILQIFNSILKASKDYQNEMIETNHKN